MEKQKVIFYCALDTFGDIHLSRSHVNKIVELFPEFDFYYTHKYPDLLKDCKATFLPEKYKELDFHGDVIEKDGIIYLNTWCGANGRKTGVNFKTIQDLFSYYFEFLLKKTQRFPFECVKFPLVYPQIDYSKYNCQKDLKIDKTKINVFICNNIPATGSGGTHSLDNWIGNLAARNPEVDFYLTNDSQVRLNNVFFAEKIGGKGLNELSYFSTFCDIIIGRGSGPFTFTHVKENFRKVWAAITNSPVLNDAFAGLLYYPEAHEKGYYVRVKDENELDFNDLLEQAKSRKTLK